MQKVLSIVIFLILSLGWGCHQKTSQEQSVNQETYIPITEAQFLSEGMELGNISMESFQQFVTCKGNVKAPANSIAVVGSQLSGFVKTIECAFGDYVKKGQVLCQISTAQLMEIQQSYIESLTNLKRLNIDYERAKRLSEEKIGSQKDFLAIESEYVVTKAKCESLKVQLRLLNLNSQKVENGDLYHSYPLLAPIDGYLTQHNLVLGEFVEQNEDLVEIVNKENLQLELFVYEKDMQQLKLGQTVYFSTGSTNNTKGTGQISRLGQAIDEHSNTIKCIADIDKSMSKQLYNGAYVKLEILVDNKGTAALPKDAIAKNGQDFFVYQLNHKTSGTYYFDKVKVEIGTISEVFTELLLPDTLTNVLIKGAYNLSVE